MNPLNLFPGTVSVCITNSISDASITSIHYLVAGERRITECRVDDSIDPGSSRTMELPFRYMTRIVFGTDRDSNHRETELSLNPSGDTIVVSRSNREYGGFFDVIIGSSAFALQNRTPVPIRAIHIDSLNGPCITGVNPLMTDEVLFLWHDSDSLLLIAVDIEGNPSKPLEIIRSEAVNTFQVGIVAFMEGVAAPRPGAIMVINGVNGECIVGVEVYPWNEEPFFFDLSDTPLGLWQSAVIPFAGQVEYLVCVDTSNRAFILDSRDESTGAYIADWWHLEFDFSFQERRSF
jgi:hypothetical protein